MNLIKKLFRKRKEYQPLGESEWEEDGVGLAGRENLDVTDSVQRRKFVEDCLEQMGEAAEEVEHLQEEYRLVNAYLKDMEEIEALPEYEKSLVEEHAKAISVLDSDRERYIERGSRMAESDYRKMERLEDEAEEAIGKLREAEEYQEKIKKDLQRLEGEKHACRYRMDEAQTALMNMRGMTVICVIAVVACVVILLLLEFVLKMDARVGYLLMAVVAALVLTVLFVKYKEADRELHSASRSYNKVIMLQNKVKIRYVNNTGLLDYLYMKYHTESVAKFEDLWAKYQVEKEERMRIEKTEQDLEFYSKQLVRQLKNYRLFDPIIWVHQAGALLDPKEMVEVRHNLILRRQSLRKQMDYNRETAESAKGEIMALVKEYPRYAEEILDMVSVYEKKYQKL
ncbi:MAG: hypothetical protein ACI4AA_04290 [Lachnospiraceae bacterium]